MPTIIVFSHSNGASANHIVVFSLLEILLVYKLLCV